MQRYRTPESIKKRIDTMLKKGKVILDHGVSAYEFDHYDYEEADYSNNYISKLHIYCKDFNTEKSVIHYMTVTESNLRKPSEDDWGIEFVSCYWEKEFPTILYMREYEVR